MQSSGSSTVNAGMARLDIGEGRVYHPPFANQLWKDGTTISQKSTFLHIDRKPRKLARQSSEPSSSMSSSSSSLASQGPQGVRENLCFMEYAKGRCTNTSCQKVHGITDEERQRMDARAMLGKVYPSSSNSSSDVSGTQPPRATCETENSRTVPDSEGSMPNLAALLAATKAMSDDEVAAMVPQNESGLPTSIGGVLHPAKCKPCRNYRGGACKFGVRCRFCHFPVHGEQRSTQRWLTCKQKRDLKEWFAGMQQEIKRAPADFDVSKVEFPDCLLLPCSRNVRQRYVELMVALRSDMLDGR